MALLYDARKVMPYIKNLPKLIVKLYAELSALDSRVDALDGAGETELSQLENSDNEADIIVATSGKVADWKAMSGDATIAANGAITIGADKVDSGKINFFASTEQTGNGSEQSIAHGLGTAPGVVMVIPSGLADSANTFVQGTHTTTNVLVTATNTAKYYVIAIK